MRNLAYSSLNSTIHHLVCHLTWIKGLLMLQIPFVINLIIKSVNFYVYHFYARNFKSRTNYQKNTKPIPIRYFSNLCVLWKNKKEIPNTCDPGDSGKAESIGDDIIGVFTQGVKFLVFGYIYDSAQLHTWCKLSLWFLSLTNFHLWRKLRL